MFRRNVIDEIEFVDTKYIGTEDALFNISVFFHVKSAVYRPDIYNHYRKNNHQSLTSGTYKKELVAKWRELYHRISKLLVENDTDRSFYDALENRRALGVIQLGLGISSDASMRLLEKIGELKKILTASDYCAAIKALPICEMPIHWKVFFLAAKGRMYITMLLLLKIMNRLRSGI